MRPEKTAMVNEIRADLEGRDFVILADCRGLTVEQFAELRGRLRPLRARLRVVRNAFLRRAAADQGWEVGPDLLDGPTAMVVGEGEVTDVAKALQSFVKETELPVLKGGRCGASVLSAGDVVQMATIPSREVLYGQVVGTLYAPMQQVVGVLNRKLASLLYVLHAVQEKKSGEVAAGG